MSDAGNIEQRVFDAMPSYPATVHLRELYGTLPFDHRSVQYALKRMRDQGFVAQRSHFLWGRTENAMRPDDRRGGSRVHGQST